MQLTRYSDYSLRVLMYLALESERLVTIAEMADVYDISRNHLVKVVHNLSRNGYVETVRGKGGGMRLAHDASSINVGDLLRRTERGLEIIDCDGMQCRLRCGCRLRLALHRARNAFVEVLSEYTVADLIIDRNSMAILLDMPLDHPFPIAAAAP
jgi:Rrf2 family nitric oxide-sensitive transcriptional repressor